MKINVFVVCFLFFVSGCSKNEDEVHAIRVVEEMLTKVELPNLKSDISIETEFKRNVLKCKVLTIYINDKDTLKSIFSEIRKNNITIYVETAPNINPICLEDSCIVAHEVLFDLLDIKPENYTFLIGINNYYKSINLNIK